ncbi:KIP1-like protein [Cynara cardunculus var. scolymus]|uniref:KIP1-like protein n=1 Tax=Cynara cardunculus var. scolymus TaxID=59895 RepID=A0A103XKD8_CYNCS|nr:KIP1-like protein [Cynara cardunculus var. scolymus]
MDVYADMEEKVHNALSIIQKDGDSFAKRAEMYYRHRPDLICFVEETFRAYRALAERYDKLSKSLQKANTTIASIFPDQISYDDFDDDDIGPPKRTRNMPLQNQGPNAAKIPKVPELPTKNLKGLISNASKKIRITNAFKEDKPIHIVPKSGLSEEEALEEIDKIQKDILAMQTTKEFIKSAYENGLSKYWEIENKINTMQQRVCRLQDEFKVARVIEDGDARTVMAQAALKSCKNTLENLEEKRENSSQAARSEHQRIVDAKQKIEALKRKFLPDEVDGSENDEEGKSQISNQDDNDDKEGVAKIRESLEEISKKPLTVSKLADTIDKLANKVISLESTVSSQTANIDNLRAQTSALQTQIQDLEADKASLADGTQNLHKKLKDLEKKLHRVEDLENDVEKQNSSLKLYFTEARFNIEHLSEKLHDVQPDDEIEAGSPDIKEGSVKSDLEDEVFEECSPSAEDQGNWESEIVVEMSIKEGELKSEEVVKEREIPSTNNDDGINNANTTKKMSEMNDIDEVKNAKTTKEKGETNNDDGVKNGDANEEKGDDGVKNVDIKKGKPKKEERNTRRNEDMVKNSDSRKENIKESANDESPKKPLKVYTTTLKNYKETKRKLSAEEKRRLETLFELTVLVRELKSGMMKKDSEIQILKQKLKQLQDELGKQNEENWHEVKQEDVQTEVKEEDEDIINISIDEPKPVSEVEERLRMEIDAILDENLDFWLRFSSQFHQVQKFKTEVEDLKEEIVKVKAKGVENKIGASAEGKTSTSMFTTDLRSEIRPIYKHLKEIQGELTVWIDQAESLKEELHRRCASLTNIQEAITMALKEGMQEDEIKFSTHQAAKFQGEILNMEQENNRVNEELEAGLHHARSLHLEIKKTLRKLEEEFGLCDDQNPYQQNFVRTSSRPGIPLRSFLFGVKARKQRPSIFGTRNHQKKVPTPRSGRP